MMQLLSLLNTFGGGALLAVAIAHVFPEALDMYPATDSDDYPAAAMLCAGGYWCLLFIDKVLVLFCVPDAPSNDASTDHPAANDDTTVAMEVRADADCTAGPGAGHGIGHATNKDSNELPEGPHSCAGDALVNSQSNMLQAVGVFLAMAVHSIFAGIALGLKCDSNSMENLAIAIVCHKMFDVSALGIVLVRADVALWKSIPLCVVVALMTPIGVWIALAGNDIDRNTNGALQAVCAGTFLYVSIQEVLAHEYSKNDGKCIMMLRAITTLLGIAMIGLASIAHTRGGHTH